MWELAQDESREKSANKLLLTRKCDGAQKKRKQFMYAAFQAKILTFKNSKSLTFFDREYIAYAVQVIHLLLLLWSEKKSAKIHFFEIARFTREFAMKNCMQSWIDSSK